MSLKKKKDPKAICYKLTFNNLSKPTFARQKMSWTKLKRATHAMSAYVRLQNVLLGWLVGWLWASRQKIYTITVGSLAGLGNEAILTQQCGK